MALKVLFLCQSPSNGMTAVIFSSWPLLLLSILVDGLVLIVPGLIAEIAISAVVIFLCFIIICLLLLHLIHLLTYFCACYPKAHLRFVSIHISNVAPISATCLMFPRAPLVLRSKHLRQHPRQHPCWHCTSDAPLNPFPILVHCSRQHPRQCHCCRCVPCTVQRMPLYYKMPLLSASTSAQLLTLHSHVLS